MASDPNMLLATVAQVAATFVSILGGFLLSLGLSRAGNWQRLKFISDRRDEIRAEFTKADAHNEEKWQEAQTEHTELLLSIQRRGLRGQLDQRQEREERERAEQLFETLRLKRRDQIEKQIQRNLQSIDENTNDMAELHVQISPLKILGGGFLILVLLGVVGVGIPLYIMPVEPGDEKNLIGWLAQRGTIVLLGSMLFYVFAVFASTASKPFSKSALNRVLFLLAALTPTAWLLWPYSSGNWILTVGGWSANFLIPGAWALRMWTNRSLPPSETRTDGLRARHRKRTNLLR